MAVINTETGAAVALRDHSTKATPRTWPFLNYSPFQHPVDTFGNYGRGAGVRTKWRTIDRTGAFRHGERRFGDVQRPNSDIDREETGRYLANKSRTASFCFSVDVELANALDGGPSRSDLARRTSYSINQG